MSSQKNKIDTSQFIFVDVHWDDPKSGARANKWRRIKVDEIPQFRQTNNNYNVFATVQRFKNPVQTTPELQYAPLFFDLDSDLSVVTLLAEGKIDLETVKDRLTKEELAHLRNLQQVGIALDRQIEEQLSDKLKLDARVANLTISRGDAKKLVEFFRGELGLAEEDVRLYFSGKKGFHILVSPEALGIEPHTELNRAFKFIALYLISELKLTTLDHGSIYGSRRVLRIPDSIHQGTRLFKTELHHAELEIPIPELFTLASSPRGSLYEEKALQGRPNDVSTGWYNDMFAKWQEAESTRNQPQAIKNEILAEMDSYPLCVSDILEKGIKKPGDRNKATMALASYFKDIGLPIMETERILLEWVEKIPADFTSADRASRRSSTRTAIRTIYEDDKYHFGCPYIRSLHGERKGREYEAVACGGRACPVHQDHQIDRQPAVKMHLSETSNAEYTGAKISFDCLVSGKLDSPYVVPKKVRYCCYDEATCDKECIMHDYAGIQEREFHENERILIEATNQNDNNLKGILRHYSGATCKKVTAEIIDYVNVEELLVVPMAERVTAQQTETGEQRSVDESGKEYVSRKIYFVGGTVVPNQYYEFEGYPYPHPKNQVGTVLSQKFTPKQDSVASFGLTPEMIRNFQVFQKQPGESVDDRVDMILDDLTQNVTLVWERDEVLLGSLLVYHSVLSFDFQQQRMPRGWLEMCVIGDSGQGKTQIVTNLLEYIGLGEMVSGESASRTGLIYRLEQMGERWFLTWGKYPLNDKKLLVIDELAGLRPEDLGTMTEARSTGVLRVDRVRNSETNARTRLIMLSNPRYGKQLFEFTHGIEALKGVFVEAADIRRLDLALFLATKDISKDVLNRKYVKPEKQLISADTLKSSVLWAWSRRPDQIEITEAALELILKLSGELSEKYGAAEDIPLVSPADQRIKLARLATALASLLHSTDELHEKIIVLPEHVSYVVRFLEIVFDAKNCRYNFYAENARSEGELLDGESAEVAKALDKLDKADGIPLSQDILELFRRNEVLKSSEIQDMTGQDKEMVNARLSVLAKKNFLDRTRSGFKKQPKFIEYLENNPQKGKGEA